VRVGEDVDEDVQIDKGTVVPDHDDVLHLLEGIPEELCELWLLPLPLPPTPHLIVLIVLATHGISINS
jgi:hypothetical protein